MNKRLKKKLEEFHEFLEEHKIVRTGTQLVLVTLLFFGAVPLLALLPGLGKAFELLGLGRSEYQKEIIRRLKKEGFIKIRHLPNGETEVVITKYGYTKVLKYHLGTMQLRNKKRWDKKWRLILFDVPEKRRILRNALRKKIKELGLLKIQQSVYIYPYTCKDEMEFIVSYFKLRPFVKYFTIQRFDGEEDYKEYFDL